MQRAFVPWGSKGGAIKLPLAPPPSTSAACDEALPAGVEPLQLWPLDGDALPEGAKPVMVDNMLCKWLRTHQREGCVAWPLQGGDALPRHALTRPLRRVQFMFECVTDLRKFGGQGCILADDMVRVAKRRDALSPPPLSLTLHPISLACAGPGQDAAGHHSDVDAPVPGL